MSLLTTASRMLCAVRHRRAVQSMAELDDRTLADIGLMRTDVFAALARPYFADASRTVKDACCRWCIFASRFRPTSDAVACC